MNDRALSLIIFIFISTFLYKYQISKHINNFSLPKDARDCRATFSCWQAVFYGSKTSNFRSNYCQPIRVKDEPTNRNTAMQLDDANGTSQGSCNDIITSKQAHCVINSSILHHITEEGRSYDYYFVTIQDILVD